MITPLSSLTREATLSSFAATVLTPEELEAKASVIVGTLGTTYRDYIHACETYNLAFFRDEPRDFAIALARDLDNHFPAWPNLFWKKLISSQTNFTS